MTSEEKRDVSSWGRTGLVVGVLLAGSLLNYLQLVAMEHQQRRQYDQACAAECQQYVDKYGAEKGVELWKADAEYRNCLLRRIKDNAYKP